MSAPLEIGTIVYGSREYTAELELRNRLLRLPLGLDLQDEDLAAEASHVHYGGRLDQRLIACAVAVIDAHGWAQIRQMAVDPHYQRQGVGRRLLQWAEQDLRRRGNRALFLHARKHAVPFYRQLGYVPVGEPFIEVTIPHLRMEKQLNPPLPPGDTNRAR